MHFGWVLFHNIVHKLLSIFWNVYVVFVSRYVKGVFLFCQNCKIIR